MSRIKSRDTGPELALRRALWAAGLRYRLKQEKPLPGRPDIVLTKARVEVFIDGCFWHGCPIHGHVPKSRAGYWKPKLERTKQRDADTSAKLAELGWLVVRFWEHQIKGDLAGCVAKVIKALPDA